jgi:hypothetical protein
VGAVGGPFAAAVRIGNSCEYHGVVYLLQRAEAKNSIFEPFYGDFVTRFQNWYMAV